MYHMPYSDNEKFPRAAKPSSVSEREQMPAAVNRSGREGGVQSARGVWRRLQRQKVPVGDPQTRDTQSRNDTTAGPWNAHSSGQEHETAIYSLSTARRD